MTLPVYTLLADLDDDGTYETDWSAYLDAIKLNNVRATMLDPFPPAELSAILDNVDSRFSMKNIDGPYYPSLHQGIGVQLKAKVTLTAVQNLDDNPSLEYDKTGWNVEGASTLTLVNREVYDGFETDESARYTGSGWTHQTQYARCRGFGTASIYYWTNFAAENVALEAIVLMAEQGGLVARYKDASNYYYLRISDNDNNAEIRLIKRVSAVETTIGGPWDIDFEAQEAQAMALIVDGTTLRVFLNRQQVGNDITDSSISGSGKAGMMAGVAGGSPEEIHFDAFRCRDLDAKARIGKSCLFVDNASSSDGVKKLNRSGNRFPVTAGNHYVWAVNTLDTTGGFIKLYLLFYDAATGGTYKGGAIVYVFPSVEWQRGYVACTAPTGSTHVEMKAICAGSPVSDFYIDGSMLYEAASLPSSLDDVEPYCDGDQPFCSWDGTAHESTSQRSANPERAIFTGKLRGFRPSRKRREGYIELEATGSIETAMRKNVKVGPFQSSLFIPRSCSNMLNRIVDVLEEGELVCDGSSRVVGPGYVGVGAASVTNVYFTGHNYAAGIYRWRSVEGDNAARVYNAANAGDGAQLVLTSVTEANKAYRAAVFIAVATLDPGSREVEIRLRDNIGTVAYERVAIPYVGTQELAAYVDIEGTFNSGSTARYLEVVAYGAAWNGSACDWLIDCTHVVSLKNKLARSTAGDFIDGLVGSNYLPIAYMDGYDEPALTLLDELARSANGWVRETGDGALDFSDISTRYPILPVGLCLSDALDGTPYGDNPEREDSAVASYTRVRVTSLGDLTGAPGDAKVVWELAPVPLTLAANERLVIPAQFTSGIGARVPTCDVVVSAGSLTTDSEMGGTSTPYVMCYGSGGDVVLVAGGSGATIDALAVLAKCQERATSGRSLVELSAPGAQTRHPETLEIDMQQQGTNSTPMTLVARHVARRYGPPGAGRIRAEVVPANTSDLLLVIGADIGSFVWFRHVRGPGAFHDDNLFILEGLKLENKAGALPCATLLLEET